MIRIRDISDYACYERIIAGCRLAAKALECKLIEVEQLWAGTEIPARLTCALQPTGEPGGELLSGGTLRRSR